MCLVLHLQQKLVKLTCKKFQENKMVRKSRKLEQRSEPPKVRRSSRFRQSVVYANDASDFSENEEELPRITAIRKCNSEKKKMSAPAGNKQQLPPLTIGQEMVPPETAETMYGVPVVELPSSPVEEKPKHDRLFLHEQERTEEDRQRLIDAASVFKSELVARLKNSAGNLSTTEMKILASNCYDVLEVLGDNFTSFKSEVNKLIVQHQEVQSAAKDKEAWNEWDMEAHYFDQAQYFCKVKQVLSFAEENLAEAKSKVNNLMVKKEEMTDALRMLTEELYEEGEKVKSMTQERDRLKLTHSEIEVELRGLNAKKHEASVAFETYNAAKAEFERMSDQLMQLINEK